MDIGLISERVTGLIVDLLSVVDEGVCKGRSGCGKQEAIAHSGGHGNEQWTVSFVSIDVEGGIIVYDARDVVWASRIIK